MKSTSTTSMCMSQRKMHMFQCFYCTTTADGYSNIIQHLCDTHRSDVVKYKQLQLDCQTGKVGYTSKTIEYVKPITHDISVDSNNQILVISIEKRFEKIYTSAVPVKISVQLFSPQPVVLLATALRVCGLSVRNTALHNQLEPLQPDRTAKSCYISLISIYREYMVGAEMEKVYPVEAMHMKSVASLIEYLREPITEDKYKEIYIVRTFLVWINHMKANGVEDIPQELGELLTSHPATSLATLCTAANIPRHVIYGIGKDMDYIPGQTEDDGNILQTAWIAFKSQERWHLVEPQRVLSSIKGHQRGGEILLECQGKLILEEQIAADGTKIMYINEDWFCLHPSILVFYSLPDDPEWQLLPSDKRISKSEFLALPLHTIAFFKANLQLLSGQTSVLQTKNGRCTVTFGAEKSSARYINMSYKLSLIKETGNWEVVDVNDLPLLVMYAPSIDTFCFNIRFPIAAEYLFETYVSAPGVDGGLTNCSLFKIICSEPDPHCKKLPLDVGNTGYGFGHAAVDFGLKNPSVHKPNVTFDCKDTEDVDMKELTFQIEDDKIDNIEFSSDVVGEDKETSVVTETRVDEVSGKLHVKAGVKKEGEYTLSIIAREKNTDQMYRRIVNFLLTTKSFGEDNEFELVSKRRKRELTLQSKMQERLDKKNMLSEKIKAIQEDIDHLKKTYEENRRSNRATQTDGISNGTQLATETKETQTETALSLHGEATQIDIITTLVLDKETQCEETNTDTVFNRSERTTLDGTQRLVLKAVEEDGKIVILAEKSEGDQTNASNPAVRKSSICAVL